MASCVKLPITLIDGEIPTAENIKTIVATFLPKEWPHVDPRSLQITYKSSFANAHCVVERPGVSAVSEPAKIFIKIHPGVDGSTLQAFDNLVPTKQEEAALCYEYGRLGLGAQVYGFFETQNGIQGRLDEFLEARNMEPEDVEDDSLRAEIAKAFATFHTLHAGSLVPRPVEGFYHALLGGLMKYHKSDKLKRLGWKGNVNIDALVDYDFTARLRRAVSGMQVLGDRQGWCIHDVQYMNVMITNKLPRRPILIDFEFVLRNYRGFDIGGHFMQKLFKWFDPSSTIAGCRPFTRQEKLHFCEQYAMQWNGRTGDQDSADQVLQEAELGYLLAIGFDVHSMLCYMDETNDTDPLNLTGLVKLFEEFVQQVESLKLDNAV